MRHWIFASALVLATTLASGILAEQCGKQASGALCGNGLCCSEFGWCGSGPDYCGSGCQSQCLNGGNSTTSASPTETGGSSSTSISTASGVSASITPTSGSENTASTLEGPSSSSTASSSSTSPTVAKRKNKKKKKGKNHKKHKHEATGDMEMKGHKKHGSKEDHHHGNSTISLTGKLLTSCVVPGSVAITYDDGPGMFTESLLDTLANKSVKATFFVIGKQLETTKFQETLKRAYKEGHQIAIHTYDHLALSKLTDAQVWNQTQTTSEIISKVIGKSPKYFRCPYGECSEANLNLLGGKGYRVVQWNLDTRDWALASKGKPTNDLKVFKKALKRANPKKDSFISLMHDIHQGSVNETSAIVDYITSKGFKPVTVAECLNDSELYF